MRLVATILVVSALSLSYPCALASGIDEKVPDPNALAALEAKAEQAQPRDQCYLYAEVVDQMTALAGHQFDAGEPSKASATLKLMQRYADKLHQGVAVDSKKLKNAELLMQHTSYRLKDILNSVSLEDRQLLEATLTQLDQIQTQLMMQVFKK